MRDELEEVHKEMEANPLFQNSMFTLEAEAYMMKVFEAMEAETKSKKLQNIQERS